MAFHLSSTPPSSQSHHLHSFPHNPSHPLFSFSAQILHLSSPFLSSWKHKNPIKTPLPSLSSPPPKPLLSLHTPTKVSLQDPSSQTSLESDPQSLPLDGQKRKTPSKNSIWVNPNSPRAARLRHHSSDSRYARLAVLAASLDSSDPTDAAVTAAISALADRPTEQDAVTVLNCMENSANAVLALRWFQNSIKIDKEVILYNVTLKVLRKSKNWDGVEALWKEMLERGVKPDNVTFSTIISCARFCNLPEIAVEWFEKMPEFECSPDYVTYSAMIDAYGRSGNIEKALGLYDRARQERWRLDPVTFATVIRVYSHSGNFDGALNVYEEMKALGVKPNVVIYNTLFDAMGRAGRPWQVKTIFKEMDKKGLVPNRATYAALLRSYCKARYAEDALSVYRQMKEKGMEMNVILYNMLLSMCADIGCVDEAAEIFAEMKGLPDDCKPDSWSYSALITAYSCSGRVLEAEGLLNEMLEAGYQPNIFVLTSIIQCYGKARQTDDVVRSFDKLLELGITPDDRFCGCLLNVLTQTPTEELGKVISCIERANVQLGSLVKLLVDEGSANEAVKQEAEELFENISNEVKKAYCNCLIDLCVNLSQSEKACVLLDMALRLEIYTDLQSKSPTQWSLHVKSLSLGAALTALHVWMNDLSKALENGEELPPLLGIHTGHGKHKYSEKGLASVFESHLRELNAPFHEAPDKVGWFLTTKVAAKSWLESRNLSESVAA
ncbi:pentatricopeptide repeat-containing protein ATP4 homolog, chloroplastic-like [Phoenix dactylifera]|uniref:Pentatricopeptide repeat-containing protein ATP4 homolog, chloroplastic-like n=1 Tax=Phoenix dactylifera TaxID=42345 RepID=A0A8B9ACN4_PHODC|nr:pentatricopeptide repeat-containing protein ATP4 homolog, chloroplastic-like [Phoenix dactylifera]XP_038983512.1 pentatricopeptide repeat-containing protein ATP4 homolog, chloroplastic-like [Phoenix dactylifera]XP_038983513.1 pentatricopeptide repeat-containing protein ATP4 homolog, chloroplastic-like [Phoenix dactylifera]